MFAPESHLTTQKLVQNGEEKVRNVHTSGTLTDAKHGRDRCGKIQILWSDGRTFSEEFRNRYVIFLQAYIT